MNAQPLSPENMQMLWLFACIVARTGAIIATATIPAFPGTPLRVRVVLSLALSLMVLPQVMVLADGSPITISPMTVLGEVLVGGILGSSISMVLGATAWAGQILGTISGLSWAEDFEPFGEVQSAGVSTFAWWVGMAAFFASGGHLAVVCGALETFTTLPVGSWPHASLETMCSLVPGLSLHLAISMAMPAMMALVAMHLVTTIIVRIAPLSPGSGLVQAAGAVVLLFSMFVGADTWARGWGEAVSAPLERILAFDH